MFKLSSKRLYQYNLIIESISSRSQHKGFAEHLPGKAINRTMIRHVRMFWVTLSSILHCLPHSSVWSLTESGQFDLPLSLMWLPVLFKMTPNVFQVCPV